MRFCLDQGIDQFLDLGSGVPTVGNVHEIARARRPGARVAYVDIEPVAVEHAQELLADVDGVTATRADLRRPARRARRGQALDQDDPELAAAMHTITAVMAASETPAYSRTRRELADLFADDPGLELLPPGLVDVTAWPAAEQREPVGVYAAVARVP